MPSELIEWFILRECLVPDTLEESIWRHKLFPNSDFVCRLGAVAQLGERLVRNEEVSGSIPLISTMFP